MNSRALIAMAILPSLLLVLAATQAPPTAQAQWSPQSCRYDAGSWPSQGVGLSNGGLMNGQGCARWHDYLLRWQVWASTLINQTSYWVWTYAEGQDTCGGGIYTSQMSSSGTAMNASSGSSGSWAEGSFLNCGPYSTGHYYRAVTQHQRQLYSSSSAEGYISAVNW